MRIIIRNCEVEVVEGRRSDELMPVLAAMLPTLVRLFSGKAPDGVKCCDPDCPSNWDDEPTPDQKPSTEKPATDDAAPPAAAPNA